jgi:hypothetical protein
MGTEVVAHEVSAADLLQARLFSRTITVLTRAVLIQSVTMTDAIVIVSIKPTPLTEAGTAGAADAF